MDRIFSYFNVLNIGGRRWTADRGTSASPPLLPSTSAVNLVSGGPLLENTSSQFYNTKDVLSRIFSTTHFISQLSFPQSEQEDSHKQIGKGQCGTIWAIRGSVLKVANPGKDVQLWNDCCKHKRVEEAFMEIPWDLRKSITIPRWENWVRPSRDYFWTDFHRFFPEDFEPTYGLLSTRINPLPAPVREAIFDQFAPTATRGRKAQILANPENKDCLVRLYLGRRADRLNSGTFKLRNFDLTVNEMEELELDTQFFARVMAQALAVMHWKAEIDADDVEFVLGRSPVIGLPPTAADLESMGPESQEGRDALKYDHVQRSAGIWLLDFDQCQNFPKTEEGIKQLERAFYFNDPYYPRPVSDHPGDVVLWNVFKRAYLVASDPLTENNMAEKFIDAVEREGQRRAATKSLFD